MRLQDLPGEHKAEAGTANSAGPRSLAAEELCEQLLLLLARDPKSRVANPDPGIAANFRSSDLDLAAVRRVLDRVREEVADDLRKPVGVAVYHQWLGCGLERQLVYLALRRVQRHLDPEQLVQVEVLGAKLEHAELVPLEVEQVVQQRRESTGFGADHLEVAPAFVRVDVPLQHQVGEAEHARERRSQLVRDVADELRLQTLALDEAPVPLLEVVAASLQ